MTASTPLITNRAPREIWPDATPGPYLLHDAMGAVQLVKVDRVRDKLMVMFTGCDEQFLAEDLSAEFEGPLTSDEVEAVKPRLATEY